MSKEIICGIYCIFNKVNHKRYIGQSVNIKARWWKHKKSLTNKIYSGDNKHLTSAWHKYGAENFEFFVVEKCSKSELNAFETFWVDYYDSTNPTKGYNKTEGGKYNYNVNYSEEDIKQYKLRYGEHSPVHILSEYDVKQIIKRFETGESSMSIARDYNVCRSTITHIRLHKAWTYLTDGLNLKQSDYCSIHEMKSSQAKPIDMYTLDGTFVKSFPSTNSAAEEFHCKSSNISNICYGKNLSMCGYTFRFCGQPFDSLRIKSMRGRPVQVDQYDMNWNLINSYISIQQAGQQTNIKPSNISHAITSKQNQAGGYHWLRHGEEPPIKTA